MKSTWNNSMARFKQLAFAAGFFAATVGVSTTAFGQTDGIIRLLNRADVLESSKSVTNPSESPDSIQNKFVHPAATLLPSDHFNKVSTIKAGTFISRQDTVIITGEIAEGTEPPQRVESPLDRKVFKAGNYRFNPHSTPQEYVFDGDDRGLKIRVDPNFNVYGLDPEDTFGHFDTLEGNRIVVPSNRVAIYAPRFSAVRKIDGVVNAQLNQPTVRVDERKQTVQATDTSLAASSKQYEMASRAHGGKRASGFLDQTRGVAVRESLTLVGARNYPVANPRPIDSEN